MQKGDACMISNGRSLQQFQFNVSQLQLPGVAVKTGLFLDDIVYQIILLER